MIYDLPSRIITAAHLAAVTLGIQTMKNQTSNFKSLNLHSIDLFGFERLVNEIF